MRHGVVELDELLYGEPIGEPRGFIRDDGVCVVVWQTKTDALSATLSGQKQWIPCADCGRMLSVPTNVIAATCPGTVASHGYVEDDDPAIYGHACVVCGGRFDPLWAYAHATAYRAQMDPRRVEETGVPLCWTCARNLVPEHADQVATADAAIAYAP